MRTLIISVPTAPTPTRPTEYCFIICILYQIGGYRAYGGYSPYAPRKTSEDKKADASEKEGEGETTAPATDAGEGAAGDGKEAPREEEAPVKDRPLSNPEFTDEA